MKSRAEYECGAGGLLDGGLLSDKIPKAMLTLWSMACERSRAVEWLGAVGFAWLIVAALRHEPPQNTLRWIAEIVQRVLTAD